MSVRSGGVQLSSQSSGVTLTGVTYHSCGCYVVPRLVVCKKAKYDPTESHTIQSQELFLPVRDVVLGDKYKNKSVCGLKLLATGNHHLQQYLG